MIDFRRNCAAAAVSQGGFGGRRFPDRLHHVAGKGTLPPPHERKQNGNTFACPPSEKNGKPKKRFWQGFFLAFFEATKNPNEAAFQKNRPIEFEFLFRRRCSGREDALTIAKNIPTC